MKLLKSAGIIIIGNEILSGKVRDANSFYLAGELRKLGVDLKRISVIPDDIDTIGAEAAGFSDTHDYVFTSGGVGPTHDDVTMEGIAKGFGVPLIEHPDIKTILLEKFNNSPNAAVLKMARVPEGSKVEFPAAISFPVVSFRNIYIFPGIPEYLKTKFASIKEQFRSSEFYLKRCYLNCHESIIAEKLNMVVEKCKDVVFGSYPIMGEKDYKVIITAESKSEALLNMALTSLIEALPEDVIVRTE